MRQTLALLLVALLVPLSGCLAGTELVEARALLDEARAHADTLLGEPELLAIGGWEPLSHFAEEDFELNVYIDGAQADGRAPGWIYVFTDGEKTVGIVVATGLGVVADFREDLWEEDLQPLGEWAVDSGAAAAALAADDRWPEPTNSTITSWYLYGLDDGPVWEVELWDLATDVDFLGMVDARTGEVRDIQESGGPSEAQPVASQFGAVQGILTPVTPLWLGFDVMDGTFLSVQMDAAMPVGAEYTITLDGETLDTGSVAPQATFERQVPGGRVVVTLEGTSAYASIDAYGTCCHA